MADTVLNSVVLVDIDAGSGETAYLTNSESYISYDNTTYTPCSSMRVNQAELTGDFSSKEYVLEALDNTIGMLGRVSVNIPYNQIQVTVKELFLTDTGLPDYVKYRFRGLVYNVVNYPAKSRLDLILRDWKYYLDTTAGVPCTEHCQYPYFGDPNCCKATVQDETHLVESISGFAMTINADPALTTPFIFNAGYVALGAVRIKIKYHASGRTFQLSRPVPSYWLGQSVTIFTGCDRRLTTCRDIHNNEERFLGLGYNMVDYNPFYENP